MDRTTLIQKQFCIFELHPQAAMTIRRFGIRKLLRILFNLTTVYPPGLQWSLGSLAFYKQHVSQQEFSLEECITNVEQIKLALRCYLLISRFFLRLLTTGTHLGSWGRQLFY